MIYQRTIPQILSLREEEEAELTLGIVYGTIQVAYWGCVFPLHLGIITTCVKEDYIVYIAAKKGTLTTDGAKRIYSSI